MKYCPICDNNYDDEAEVCELDGATLRLSRPKQDSLINKVIKGRYRVLKKLGEGGMGTVYLADQFAINRKVALKIVHPDYAKEDFVKRFRQEATLAASFSHHNVVTVFDFDQADDGSLYIVMEYVDGRNLGDVIQNNPMEVRSALQLGVQIAEGLSAAHRAGIIHRDIKPENIMVVEGGRAIKLMDFGIARLRDGAAATRLTQAGMIMGTPAYMAPEQIEGRELSDRTDIYAFGIVLYEMLTGRVPFKAPTPGAVLVKHLHEAPVPLRKLRKEIPSSLERIVIQALQKNPEKRLSGMEEVVEALKTAQREIEQFGSDGAKMAAMRRALGAAATPFRKLWRKGTSDSTLAKRNDEPTALHNIEDAGTTAFRGAPGELRADRSEVAVDLQSETRARQPTSVAEIKARISTLHTVESVAETVALTQPIDVQEQLIQGPESLDDGFKDSIDNSVRQETRGAASEADRTAMDGWPAPSRRDKAEVPASLQRHNAQVLGRPSPREQQSTIAAEMTRSSASSANETIAETVTFTQPIEKITNRKRGWIVAAAVGGLVILIGMVAGVTLFREVLVVSSVPTVATEEPKSSESTVPQARTDSQSFTLDQKKEEEQRSQDLPALALPEVKVKERPASKGVRTKDREILSAKTNEKPVRSPGPVTALPDSKTIKEPVESKERAKAPAADLEQKPYPKAVVEVETAKKSDSTGKKTQESAGDQIASLKKPEAPSPPQTPAVKLKDLSIITSRRDLKVKERLLLTVKVRYSDGKEMEITGGVQWKSSDTGVAVVNSRGELEALKEGKTQISATYDGVGSGVYIFNVTGSEDIPKTKESGEQIKDLRRRMLR